MFDLGTKITLIASSHKKTGPRKNSIGYITTSRNSSSSYKDKIVTIPATVKFLRYGNEEKYRFETKQLLLAFPIIANNIENKLKIFMDTVNSSKYTGLREQLCNRLAMVSNTTVAVAVPMYTPNISFEFCRSEEFYCWFESCLLSQQVGTFINKALLSKHLFKKGTECITAQELCLLRDMIIDKYTRQHVLKDICSHHYERVKWISILRMLLLLERYFEQQIVMPNLHKIMIGKLYNRDIKGKATISGIYSTVMPYLFRTEFSKFKSIFVANKRFNNTIKEMETTKKAILALST